MAQVGSNGSIPHKTMDETRHTSSSTTPPSSEGSKTKYRAKQSCIPCRTRKVKCDRIKPCQACCVRGQPSQCEYVASNEERFLISQADAIEGLRKEVATLRQQLAGIDKNSARVENDTNPPTQDTQRPSATAPPPPPPPQNAPIPTSAPQENYKAILDVIASAPADVAANVVSQVRGGAPLDQIVHLYHQLPVNAAENSSSPSHRLLASQYGGPINPDTLNLKPSKRIRGGSDREGDDSKGGQRSSAHGLPIRSRSPSILPETVEVDVAHSEFMALSRVPQMSRKRHRSPPLAPYVSPRHVLLESLLGRFVDSFSPDMGTHGPATVMRLAAGIRMFSPLLADAFRAVSISYAGRSVVDNRMMNDAYKDYQLVLRDLQHALYDQEKSKSQGVLLTVMVLVVFESVQRSHRDSIINHILGAMRLLEHRGPYRHMFGIEHTCFTEFRPYWVCMAVVTRSPSFLAREEWKVIPWAAGTSTKEILHYLLDIVADIPEVLSQFDKFMAGINSGVILPAEITTRQAILWREVTEIDNRLLQWKKEWVDDDPDAQPTEVTDQGDENFPVFQCRNMATMEVITPKTLVYPNLRVAQVMCIWYAVRIVLFTADTRPTGAITRQDLYAYACGICRSLEYYVRTLPGSLIGRLAFPCRAAYDALPERNVERRFLVEVFKLVEDKYKLQLFQGTLDELSAQRKQAD